MDYIGVILPARSCSWIVVTAAEPFQTLISFGDRHPMVEPEWRLDKA